MKKTLLTILSPLFLFVFISMGTLIWYQSQPVPSLGSEYQVTMFPTSVRQVLGAATSPNSLRIPIFMYHYVEYVHNDPGKQNLNIPPNILQAQIETLKNAGYTFITPTDLSKAISQKAKLPAKVIMLTFDDGYMDFYTDVFPILQKEQVKGTEYVIVNLLNKPNYLLTTQLQEVAKSPLVEIGAHTMNHYALAGMNATEATYEIAQSRKDLQDLLHVPVASFAYPYGSFDVQAIRIVKDAGFTTAMSVIPGIVQTPDNKYFFNRLRPGYRTGDSLLTYLKQDVFQPW